MLDAATSNSVINIEHLLFLLSKKKHLSLADGDKATVIKRVMNAFPSNGAGDGKFLSLLQKLFECGFLEFISEIQLLKAFYNQQLMEIILNANKHIFKHKISSTVMEKLIQTNDFIIAEMMLILNVNSSKEALERNYLDLAYISNSSCQRFLLGLKGKVEGANDFDGGAQGYHKHCTLTENERYDFIHALKLFGVDFIFSFSNYHEALKSELYDWAAALLKASHFGARSEYETRDKKISPLSVAFASRDIETIDAVMVTFLEKLTIEQLLKARSVADWNEEYGRKWILQIESQIKKKLSE